MSSDIRAFIGQSPPQKRLDSLKELKESDEKIKRLEEVELGLKSELGLSKDADSAEVHQKLREELEQLNDLRRHRLQRNCIVVGLEDYYPTELIQSLPLPPCPSHIVKSSQIHAVIVGINMYESYLLRGCVSDARLMEKYLTEDLGVPNNHIQLLLGSEEHSSPDDPMNPSRANIHALLSLATNAEIKDGDIIIIYFAGHGSSYSTPDGVAIYGVIETQLRH
ncbi:uncharacterized protein ARMOST_22141 [Armillaria ostoyae]|uniref:Peptidase C14 caspase domain-containing protein n=1 Tax=Armillaria ostoyae TaxID=47428 RepID=A0A284SC18_ARMOS|nr:uncharacterized protein ARMOST_22141 [Armillaria ostoyae]